MHRARARARARDAEAVCVPREEIMGGKCRRISPDLPIVPVGGRETDRRFGLFFCKYANETKVFRTQEKEERHVSN